MRLRPAALAAALALCPVLPATAETLHISPDQARAEAGAAIRGGNPALGAALADALIRRDGGDANAHVLRALAAAQLRDWPRARTEAATVWRLTDDRDLRRQAAEYAARAAEAEGRFQLARFWLRRAANLADGPAEDRVIAQRFQALRAKDPLQLRFGLSVSPSSNINGGTSASSFNWLGFDFVPTGSSKALSGYQASVDLGFDYRLRSTRNSLTTARLDLHSESYWLSDEARREAPGTKGSAFDFASAEVGLSHRFRRDGSKLIWGIDTTLGRTWYGHEPLANLLRLDGLVLRPLTPSLGAQGRLTVQQQWRQDNDRNDALTLGVSGALTRRFGNGDVATLTLGARRNDSDSESVAYRAGSIALSWQRGRPLGPVGLGASLSVERRSYPDYSFSPGGRHDIRASASVDVVFDRVAYYGFSPVMTVSANRTWSDFDFFDSRTYGLAFGLQSRF